MWSGCSWLFFFPSGYISLGYFFLFFFFFDCFPLVSGHFGTASFVCDWFFLFPLGWFGVDPIAYLCVCMYVLESLIMTPMMSLRHLSP